MTCDAYTYAYTHTHARDDSQNKLVKYGADRPRPSRPCRATCSRRVLIYLCIYIYIYVYIYIQIYIYIYIYIYI